MTTTALTMTDEELAEMREAQVMIKNMIAAHRHVLDNIDSYTKEEIARDFREHLDLFEMMTSASAQLIEGTIEINQMLGETSTDQ